MSLREQFAVQVRTMQADLGNPTSVLMRRVRSVLHELDVALVVSNAGVSRRLPDDFHTIRNDDFKT